MLDVVPPDVVSNRGLAAQLAQGTGRQRPQRVGTLEGHTWSPPVFAYRQAHWAPPDKPWPNNTLPPWQRLLNTVHYGHLLGKSLDM